MDMMKCATVCGSECMFGGRGGSVVGLVGYMCMALLFPSLPLSSPVSAYDHEQLHAQYANDENARVPRLKGMLNERILQFADEIRGW